MKASKVKARAPSPLTRRERKTLAEARQLGLAKFGPAVVVIFPPPFESIDKPVTTERASKLIGAMTDSERHLFFWGMEAYIDLTMVLRGEN